METANVMGFVGALNDPLRGPTFHIASGCTTAAAPCAVQTYSVHWDAILPRIGLDERCGPVAPNRPT
jgi:hypothetical protein